MKNKILLSILVFILISEAVLTGILPHSRGSLYNYLELKEGPIYLALFLYFCNYFVLDFFQAIKGYTVTKVAMVYRTIRTESLKVKNNLTNVPQRIQEDIKLSYTSRITVWCEYFISGTILVQLILLNLGEPILVIAALIYAGISIVIAMLFNPRLTHAEIIVQEKEADFRQSLLNVFNPFHLKEAIKATMKSELIRTQYLLFTKLQLGLITVLPYLVLIPSLFDGTITLGGLIKHQASFALIVVNAAILIQYYPLLIKGKASEKRVSELE